MTKPAAPVEPGCLKCGRDAAFKAGCSIVDCPHRRAWTFDPDPPHHVRQPMPPTIRDLFDPYYEDDDR